MSAPMPVVITSAPPIVGSTVVTQAERTHRAVGEVIDAAVAGLRDDDAGRIDPLHETAVAEDDVAAGAAVQLVGADAAEDHEREGRGLAVDDVVIGRADRQDRTVPAASSNCLASRAGDLDDDVGGRAVALRRVRRR